MTYDCLHSDQSDPFNRQSLTLDMVTPNTELKEKIEKWKAEMANKQNSQTEDETMEEKNEEETQLSNKSDMTLFSGK